MHHIHTHAARVIQTKPSSLYLAVIHFLMKLLRSNNKPLTDEYLAYFNFELRCKSFEAKFRGCINVLIKLLVRYFNLIVLIT
jgi:hypothetical protein